MIESVKKHFDQLAPRYGAAFSDRKSGKTFEFAARLRIVESVVRGSSGALLDCACGTGQITAAALHAGTFTSAVVNDISPAMLARAEESLSREPRTTAIEFREGDIFEYLPGPDRRFDVILCLGLIAHTGRLVDLLSHLSRLLTPTGRIVLQSSVANHPLVRFVRAVTRRRNLRRDGYTLSYFTLRAIHEASARVGLRVTRTDRYCFGFPFGDAVSSSANFWLERALQHISAARGTEAILVLEPEESSPR